MFAQRRTLGVGTVLYGGPTRGLDGEERRGGRKRRGEGERKKENGRRRKEREGDKEREGKGTEAERRGKRGRGRESRKTEKVSSDKSLKKERKKKDLLTQIPNLWRLKPPPSLESPYPRSCWGGVGTLILLDLQPFLW